MCGRMCCGAVFFFFLEDGSDDKKVQICEVIGRSVAHNGVLSAYGKFDILVVDMARCREDILYDFLMILIKLATLVMSSWDGKLCLYGRMR